MDQATHNKIVSFIWGIADDVLRDLFKRGKYPDVILPMCVIRRMDAVLEPTKKAVLDTKKMLDEAGITEQRAALCDAAGQAFYNTSKFTLRDLKSRGSQQQLLADFEDYLNGFSPNVQDILDNFKFRNQLPTLSKADAIGTLINKFLDPDIDLSPAGIDNHSMGTVFEELVRKFNEENNEEAGEHWTPRDAVRLMANLVFLPIEAEIKSGTYLLYDCACGTGGMLTVAEETLTAIAAKRGQQVKCLLYGQEINPETYAVCKADMLLKGEGESADHIVGGAEWSTLSHDAFPAQEFDFMLANPPYGKSWKKDLEAMGGKDGMRDPRFKVMHKGEELSLVTRSSDGQMLFLANMASKMNDKSALGSRIAEVHNGSSLFTGDAGQGESNIRRWLIENDWLEAIVALPLNLFYNTGIATYIWVLSNKKPAHRKGQVQLIDATPVVQAAAQEPRQEELRTLARGHRAHQPHLPRLQGNAGVEDLPQRRLRLLEGHGRAPAAPAQPAHAQGHRDAALRLRRRRPARRALRGVRRRPLHQLRQGLRRAGEAPGRLGQRRGRRRRRRGRQHEEGPAREEEKEAARPQDLGARRPPGRSCHEAARGAGRHALRGPQRLPRPRGCRAQEGRHQARRRRPEADPQGRELARRDRAAGHRQGAQAGQGQGRPAARPVRGDGGRQARHRRVRARLRPARHRAGAAAGRRRHRSLHPPRGAALHARCVDQGGRHQDRLRGQLHPPLLQAAAAAHAGGDQRRHPRHREGGRGAAG